MVSINKDKTGGGSGPATPPHRNRRQAGLEVSPEHNVNVAKKVDSTPGAEAPKEIRTGYHKWILTLIESNKTFFSFQ